MAPTARYTHGHHDSVLRSHRWRTVENSAAYLVPHLSPGRALLDVGCGPGTITADLARRLSPGRVVGMDAAPAAIAEAAAQEGLPDNVTFEVGDLYHLDHEDGSFDIVHAHQVLQHLADPVGALAEMRRVCAPRGVVATRDADLASSVHFPPDPQLDRWLEIHRLVIRGNGGEPDAGRRLLDWARQAGFGRIHASASAWCFATEEDRQWWGGLWADRVVQSSFAEQALELDLADRSELESIAGAWRRWSAQPSGWFAMVHGEVLCGP